MRFVSALSVEANIKIMFKNYNEAKTIALRYINILAGLYPADYPINAIALNNLAIIEIKLFEFTNAKENSLKAISIGEKKWGANHRNLLTFRANLIDSLIALKDLDEAEKMLSFVIKTREKNESGKMNNFLVSNYMQQARIYFITERKKESIAVLDKLLIRMRSMEKGVFTQNQELEVRKLQLDFIKSK